MKYCTYDTKCQNPIIIEKLIEEKELLKQKIEQLKEHNKYILDLIKAERRRQEECDDVHLRNIATLEKENEQLKSELETYQILAHKRGECYLSSLREIKKQKEENEQLKQQIEKMKICENCKHSYHDRYHTLQCIRNCINFDNWELAE